MTRKHRRLLFAVLSFVAVGCVSALAIYELGKNISFFYTTSELLLDVTKAENKAVRVGGMVEVGSVTKNGYTTTFLLTDTKQSLRVVYTGVLPPMFGEGLGAVVKGRLQKDGTFLAEEILAKHDETYMPRKYNIE